MKSSKAAGPSGVVVEMIKAAGDTGATMIRDLATVIIHDAKVPYDWEQSFIVCLYKSKGDALNRGISRGIKQNEQAMNILGRIVDGLIRQVVCIDDSQFGFVPGRGTTDALWKLGVAVSPGNVRQCPKPGFCWQGLQSWVWGEGRCPPGIGTQSLALHHYAGSLVRWVPLWSSLGGPICRSSLLTRWRNVSGDSWYGKKPWRRRDWG